jgi:hypothetical protein
MGAVPNHPLQQTGAPPTQVSCSQEPRKGVAPTRPASGEFTSSPSRETMKIPLLSGATFTQKVLLLVREGRKNTFVIFRRS